MLKSQGPYITIYFTTGNSDEIKTCYLESSIPSSGNCNTLNDLRLTFNDDVQVSAGATATFTDDDADLSIGTVNSTSMTVDPNDPKTVIVSFTEQTLYNAIKYTVTVPEGAVSLASDAEVSNKEFTLTYTGTEYRYFGVKAVTPAEGGTAIILNVINVTPDFPKGCGFVYLNTAPKYEMKLYKGTDTNGECLATFNGALSDNTVSLDFNVDYPYEENTEYTFVMEDEMVKPYIVGDVASRYRQDCLFSRTELHYTTAKASDLPKVTVSSTTPEDGASLDKLESFNVAFVPYEYDGNTYKLGLFKEGTSDASTWELYEVTADGDTKIHTSRVYLLTGGQSLYAKNLNITLYEGKTYKLVIPAGMAHPNNQFISQYVQNEDVVITLAGATDPTGITVSGGIAEDAMLAQLGVVAFYVDGTVKAAEGATVKLMQGDEVVKEVPVVVADASGNTIVIADFSDDSHAPMALEDGAAYTVVLPQGSVLGVDGIMTNPELTMAFTGASLVPETETASVSITVGDNFTTVAQAVKGEPYTFSLVPDDGWTVASVKVGGEPVELTDNAYTIEELTSDTTIVAVLEGEYEYEDNEGTSIEAAEYGIYAWSDGEKIIIEGLSGYSDNVRVYTLGGTLVGHSVAASSRAEITVPAGVYIIRVSNGQMNFGMKLIHN